ncbi:RHOMBOID-like protein 12, mitochondrial isoform X2 [Eucalyptus grandis]|uniref:RHOMBOID-like protein 12, mitochondrial isoform X2 n=1 Tax=Eucalyptus grandis TaxID=71139 RepID=UPI00192EDAE8|nr:RHOMBOID-like protein 12, mitochondrial isoform X2 [Eucalyptus grandis]
MPFSGRRSRASRIPELGFSGRPRLSTRVRDSAAVSTPIDAAGYFCLPICRKSWFRRLTVDNVVLGLIITNVAVFMLWQIADRSFMMKNFTISLDNFKSGHLHTLITSAFSHMTMEHLIYNMIGLYFFGYNIGRNFGPEFLLKLYLAGAFGGSIFYLVHHAFMHSQSKGQGMFSIDPSRMPGLGASGAVNAIMLLDIFLFPKATLYFDFIIPVPAILLGIFLVGKDVLRIIQGDSEISGSAHLGGAAVAALTWARLRKGRF